MSESFQHIPVLQQPALELLCGRGGRRFIDGTLGGGGDSAALLERLPQCEVLGIDRDPAAIAVCRERLARFGGRFHPFHGCFSQLDEAAAALGWETVDGILLDIGVSSPQIDTPERGFSFRFDAPLDMRMNPENGEATAADLLNTLPEEALADIFFRYGEERKSRIVARRIAERRRQQPWRRTGELAELLERVVGRAHQHGLPAPTRVFQALRIAVNRELEELEKALDASARVLCPGGRLVVISFHSLEDRTVKRFMQYSAQPCICPPGFPCTCHKQVTFEILTRKPVVADERELALNSRAACAKLRAAQRTAAPVAMP